MKKNYKNFLTFFIFGCFFFSTSFAEISFEISEQQIPKTKILFFGFDSSDPNLSKDAQDIFNKIQTNLNTTNLFEVIIDNSSPQIINNVDDEEISLDDKKENNIVSRQIRRNIPTIPDSFDQNSVSSINSNITPTNIVQPRKVPLVSVEMLPDFVKYNKAEIGAILIAEFSYDIKGNLETKLRLWDVLDQRQLFGKLYSSSQDNYQKLANIISDKIFTALTGEEKGHFNSKILYISETGRIKRRVRKVRMINFSGEDKKTIIDDRNINLTPVFSKKRNEIYYLSYQGEKPQIYSKNIMTNRTKKVGGFYGTTFAAYPHPQDDNIILLSAIFDGNTDIYELNIEENRALRLTKNKAIDSTASYSPDGNEVVFISDRDGSRKIYIIDKNDFSIRKISHGRGNYAKPVFSPDGNLICFTLQKQGKFYIGLMSKDGSNEKLLTSAYLVEGAKWSPNGRYLIYSKKISPYGKKSIPKLFTIDIVTGHEYQIPLEENEGASDPDWVLDN